MTTTILLGGFDVSEYLNGGFTFKEYRTLERDLFILNDLNLRFNNHDGIFSSGNGNFLFAGGDVRGKEVEVKVDGVVFWKGKAEYFSDDENSRISILKAKNELALFKNTPLDRTESDANPVTVARDILQTEVGLPDDRIDLNSFNRSADLIADNGLLIDADFSTVKRKKLTKGLEDLARVSCADLFTTRGVIVFDTFEPKVDVFNIKLNKDMIQDVKRDGKQTRYLKNEYILDYDGGTGTKDGDNNNIGDESRTRYATESISLKYGTADLITIKSLAGGVWLGEQYIIRQQLPKDWIQFTLPMSVEPSLSLKSAIGIDFTKYGYSEKVFQIMSITYNIGRQLYFIEAMEL